LNKYLYDKLETPENLMEIIFEDGRPLMVNKHLSAFLENVPLSKGGDT
jgi:hypothetical protein